MEPAPDLPTEYAADGAVLTVERDRVTITRKGPAGALDGRCSVREIAMESIRAVLLKRPGMTPGYLHLCTSGDLPPESDLAFRTGGRYDANTLLLSRRHYPAFEEARALIEAMVERSGGRARALPGAPAAAR